MTTLAAGWRTTGAVFSGDPWYTNKNLVSASGLVDDKEHIKAFVVWRR